jgi:hypothetical protein
MKSRTGVLPTLLEMGKPQKNNAIFYIKLLRVLHNSTYFFLLFVLNVILLLQVYKCYVHYLEGPTYVETRIVPQRKALFPEMTICAVKGGYKADVLKVDLFCTIDCFSFSC